MRDLFVTVLLLTFALGAVPAQTPYGFDNMLASRRVGDPQYSPTEDLIAFTVGVVDKAANRTLTQIYTVRPDGTGLKQITKGERSSSNPRWSPDGKRIAFVHDDQIWTMEPDGDDREQITRISTGAENPVWSPNGRWIAFNSDVYPECTSDDCNKAEDEKAAASKVKAKVTTRLLYRHWVAWRDRKRTHVLVVVSNGGVARDITPGDFDSPPYGAASGVDFAFSPDSSEIAYLRNFDPVEATSTNSDVVVVPLAGGTARNITAANKGYEASPVYTRDGKYILYRSQATATFEADRWRIMRYDRKTGQAVDLTRGFDQQVGEFIVSPDGKTIYFAPEEAGKSPIFSVPVEPDLRLRIATFVKPVITGGYANHVTISPDGQTLVFLSSSLAAPAEVFSARVSGGEMTAVTRENPPTGLTAAESISWKGALNKTVHGFVVKPANFVASRRYPLIVLIHGGPQGAWNDNWGYRWNPQIFANAGYVVLMPNPRGSTGFGQQFVNDVSADWGGKAFVDIKNGVAEMIRRPYVDKSRIGGAGASYGGYMIDWILGHNDDPRFRFKALVSHAGVYNLESMAGATEELWFVNWEFKGMPWENPVNYNRWSPHKFAAKFATPTLVTAGELDYRVPVDQSLQLYTALQLKKVDSKLIVFPDEGHWILKPQNSEFWYRNVLDWFAKHL